MRFSILHGLVLMVLIALAMVYVRVNLETNRIDAQLEHELVEIEQIQKQSDFLDKVWWRYFYMNDYLETWRAWETAMQDQFSNLQDKHSRIQPVEGRLVIREFPRLQTSGSTWKSWRLHVPSDAQLTVCFGADSKKLAFAIDSHVWSKQSLLVPTGPFSGVLSPGEHTLELRNSDAHQKWVVKLDGQVLLTAQSEVPFNGHSYQGISCSMQQTEVPNDRLPVNLYYGRYSSEDTTLELHANLWIDLSDHDYAAFPGEVVSPLNGGDE